jgi:hypothetical protein
MTGSLIRGIAVGKGAVIQDGWDNGMLLAEHDPEKWTPVFG